MVVRDEGPLYNLGFGKYERPKDDRFSTANVEGPNPESGPVAKALHDHPIMKFIATGAAMMASMHIAGSVVKKGGIKLLARESARPGQGFLKDFGVLYREVQGVLDDMEGLARIYADPTDPTKIFAHGAGGTVKGAEREIIKDQTVLVKGFSISAGDREEALRLGVDMAPSDWTMKDEVRQRLVRSARRLPYELPALYLTQRAVIDPLTGENTDKKVKWYNPVDVTTDFVNQSVKNLALMIGPFEAGAGASTHAYRKVFSYGSGTILADPGKIALRKSIVTMQASLEQVGHDASGLLDKVVKLSKQTSGAFSAGVEEASSSRVGIVQALHKLRRGDYAAMLKANAPLAQKLSGLSDNIPGTFGGISSGVKAARARFNEIGESHDAFVKLMKLGRTEFSKSATANEKEIIKSYFGSSPLTALAEDFRLLGRGSPAVTGKNSFTREWSKSGFYRGRIQDEYQSKIEQNLYKRFVEQGHSKADAKKLANDFSSKHQISISERADTDISNRLLVGGKVEHIDVGESGTRQDYINKFVEKLSYYSKKEQSLLSSNLNAVIEETDSLFASKAHGGYAPYRRMIEEKIKKQWGNYVDNDLEKMASHMVSSEKRAYNSFEMRVGGADHEYLLKKAARTAGMDVDSVAGSPQASTLYRDHLNKIGLRADSPENLRGFLTQEKQIAKPWQRNGYNLLGIRRVSTESFLSKGLHGDNPSVKKIIGTLSKTHTAESTSIPGLYETRGGNIIDINSMRRSAAKTLDSIATNYKIPIVNFNPLQLLGYGKRQALTETSVLSYIPGMSRQPFLGEEAQSADFFMMLRRHGRAAKGEVRAFKGTGESTSLGMYQPTSANSLGMAGRQARIASGDFGYAPLEQPKEHTGRIRNIFLKNNASYQQGSIGGLVARFTNRYHDVKNPVTMARFIRGDIVSDAKGSYQLIEGEIRDVASGAVIAPKEEVSSALDVFHKFVNKNVFPKALRKNRSVSASMEEIYGEVKKLFSHEFRGKAGAKSETISLSDLKTTEEKVIFGKRLSKDAEDQIASLHAAGRTKEAQQLSRTKKTLLDAHLDKASGNSYWDRYTGQGTGVRRRIDNLTSDMEQYLIISKGLTSQETGENFANSISTIAAHISELKRTGVLSNAEAVEANAALLSTQLNYSKITTFDNTKSVVQSALDVIETIAGRRNPLAQALDDIASGATGATSHGSSRIATGMQAFVRRNLGMAEESYSGLSYNPFGKTNVVLTPTIGQSVKTEGVKQTVLSALGVNTYRNPRAFNTISNMTSHVFERLNRYASVFGAGVDPTKFAGPLDMFGRGLIGQRVAPLYVAGTVAFAADATLGGMINPKDSNGNRVYSPFVLGQVARPVAEAQAGIAGLIPGGQNYSQAREDIFHGEVPVRKARYWPLGRKSFFGEGVEYYRPSWYRRMKAGTAYPTGYDNPVERLLYGYDFSPLRPLDPYRFENKHAEDRPYPVSGDYFTGPFGPITPLLNSTIGRVLKPRRYLKKDETNAALGSTYNPVGESGAYSTIPYGTTGSRLGGSQSSYSVFNALGSGLDGDIAGRNQNRYLANVGTPQYTGSGMARSSIKSGNTRLALAAYGKGNGYGTGRSSVQTVYGLPNLPGIMQPAIIANRKPISEGGFNMQARSIGYRAQETLGIYGFAFGALRTKMGFGTQDFAPKASVLESATNGSSSVRAFWNLNIGGVGDAPSETLDLNLSEAVRRLVPHRPSGVNYLNPIKNSLGEKYPWLPGAEYYKDFTRGDPYTAVPEGEFRLPGAAYERLNTLGHGAQVSGKYGELDVHKMLGNIAPYSQKYEDIDKLVDTIGLSPSEQLQVEETRRQVASVRKKHSFSEYQFQDGNASWVEKRYEQALHTDNMLFRKLGRRSSAVEDWERNNVYGPTFQQWQKPVQSFLSPMVDSSTQKNPLFAAGHLGLVASFFGKNPEARLMASSAGVMTGAAAGAYGTLYKAITGDRFMPKARKGQAALEEYTDILTYTKNIRLQRAAQEAGDNMAAEQFKRAASRTMYGADLANGTIQDILSAIPKRKREHFESFFAAPEKDRDRIISTMPRLERRILQAAWGRKVEKLPDLNEFFKNRELPGPAWEGWLPNTNMDFTKIKIGQYMGLDLSQMGYYPQQIRQANLVNPSYPSFTFHDDQRNVQARLEAVMSGMGANGDVSVYPNPFGEDQLRVDQGVFA